MAPPSPSTLDANVAFRRLSDSLPQPICVIGNDGQCIDNNLSCRAYTGLDKEQLSERPFDDLLHPEDVAVWRCRWNDAKQTGAAGDVEVRLRAGDRSYHRFSIRLEPIVERAPGRDWLAIATDIATQASAPSQVLPADEDWFHLVADWIPQLIWSARADGYTDYHNRRFLAYLGRTRAEMQGDGWVTTLHPNDRRAGAESWKRAVRTGSDYQQEFRIRRGADGAFRWYIARAVALRDPAGNVVRWFGTCTDIDDSKRAEQALRNAEQRFRATVEHAPVGVADVAPDGRIEFANEGFCALLGYTQEELRDLTWQQITHPDDLAADESLVARTMSGELPYYTLDKRYIRKDGSAVWVSLFGNFIRDEAGGIVKGVGVVVDITERRRIEQRLAGVLVSIDDHLVTFDHDWRYTYLNEAAVRLLGKPREELLGARVWDIFPESVGTPLGRDLHQAARERRSIRSEHYYEPWGRWFLNHIYPTADGVTVYGLDITERKRAEQAQQESEARFRLAVSASPHPMMIHVEDGTILTVNHAWTSLSGYGVEQIPTIDAWVERAYGERKAFARTVIDCLYRTGEWTHEGEFTIRTAAGEYRIWDFRSAPLGKDPAGRRMVLSTATDVTEHHRILAALRDSEERFRMLADNISQFAWIADKTGQVVWYNQRWYDYTGTTLKDVEGWGWTKVPHPDHVDRVVERIQRSWDTGEPWEDLFPLRNKNGEYRWFLSRALPIRDENGNIERWFGTNTDVTEQRAAEQALRDADRRKDEFLAMLGHELRNPLAPLRTAVAVLRQIKSEDPLLEKTRSILDRQVNQIVRMVDDLLDVSRITRGKIELRKEPLSATEVIEAAIEAARPLIDAKRHVLWAQLEPGLELEGDRARLVQVLTNLLTNAAKFTPSQGRIALVSRSVAGQAVIAVRDNGVGIDRDAQDRIFDLFAQENTAADRSRGGLGIGLTVVKHLVQMHGGTVEVHSEGPSRGSEFVIRLPLQDKATGTTTGRPPIAASPGNSLRVVIVEDNEDVAMMFRILLELEGHEVSVAGNGFDGLRAIEQIAPDVAFVDLGLPGIDGFTVARQIRDQGRCCPLLVAVSGYGRPEDQSRARASGFDEHVTKPIGLEALHVLLMRAASLKAAGPAPAGPG